jgi:hypothetical protein
MPSMIPLTHACADGEVEYERRHQNIMDFMDQQLELHPPTTEMHGDELHPNFALIDFGDIDLASCLVSANPPGQVVHQADYISQDPEIDLGSARELNIDAPAAYWQHPAAAVPMPEMYTAPSNLSDEVAPTNTRKRQQAAQSGRQQTKVSKVSQPLRAPSQRTGGARQAVSAQAAAQATAQTTMDTSSRVVSEQVQRRRANNCRNARASRQRQKAKLEQLPLTIAALHKQAEALYNRAKMYLDANAQMRETLFRHTGVMPPPGSMVTELPPLEHWAPPDMLIAPSTPSLYDDGDDVDDDDNADDYDDDDEDDEHLAPPPPPARPQSVPVRAATPASYFTRPARPASRAQFPVQTRANTRANTRSQSVVYGQSAPPTTTFSPLPASYVPPAPLPVHSVHPVPSMNSVHSALSVQHSTYLSAPAPMVSAPYVAALPYSGSACPSGPSASLGPSHVYTGSTVQYETPTNTFAAQLGPMNVGLYAPDMPHAPINMDHLPPIDLSYNTESLETCIGSGTIAASGTIGASVESTCVTTTTTTTTVKRETDLLEALRACGVVNAHGNMIYESDDDDDDDDDD